MTEKAENIPSIVVHKTQDIFGTIFISNRENSSTPTQSTSNKENISKSFVLDNCLGVSSIKPLTNHTESNVQDPEYCQVSMIKFDGKKRLFNIQESDDHLADSGIQNSGNESFVSWILF